MISLVPPLTGAEVIPPSATVYEGATQVFTASTVCQAGECPAGANYTWSLNNDNVGQLMDSTLRTTIFVAGSVVGNAMLFLNATLNGVTKKAMPVRITVAPMPGQNYLSSVALSPSSATVSVGGDLNLTASAVCAGGPCPFGTFYTWSLTDGLGALNVTVGPAVRFTAGSTVGTVTVFVAASLNGWVVSSYANIVIGKPTVVASSSNQTGMLVGLVTAMVAFVTVLGVSLALSIWKMPRGSRPPTPKPRVAKPTRRSSVDESKLPGLEPPSPPHSPPQAPPRTPSE
jgi:hypothetical protein